MTAALRRRRRGRIAVRHASWSPCFELTFAYAVVEGQAVRRSGVLAGFERGTREVRILVDRSAGRRRRRRGTQQRFKQDNGRCRPAAESALDGARQQPSQQCSAVMPRSDGSRCSRISRRFTTQRAAPHLGTRPASDLHPGTRRTFSFGQMCQTISSSNAVGAWTFDFR